MGSDDSKPKSLMSRNKGDNKVITGARSIKYWQRPSWGISGHPTWLSNPDEALNPPDLSDDERPKAKKPMFKHVPRVVDPKKLAPTATAATVDNALDSSTKSFGHSRGGSGQGQPHGGWNLQHTHHQHHPHHHHLPSNIAPQIEAGQTPFNRGAIIAAGQANVMLLQSTTSPPT